MITLSDLEAAGLTAAQIVRVYACAEERERLESAEVSAAQRERNRKNSRRYRARIRGAGRELTRHEMSALLVNPKGGEQ